MQDISVQAKREHDISRLMRQLERARRTYMNKCLEGTGLKGDVYRFILTISNEPGICQDDLAADLLLDASNAARIAQIIETDGMITRTKTATNRRLYEIQLTPKGEEMAALIRKSLSDWHDIVFADIDEENEAALMDTMQAMLKATVAYEKR